MTFPKYIQDQAVRISQKGGISNDFEGFADNAFMAIAMSKISLDDLFSVDFLQKLSLVKSKKSEFPHVTILQSFNVGQEFQILNSSIFAGFFDKLKNSPLNNNLVSTGIYTYHNKERNVTFLCMGFKFENEGLQNTFMKTRESLYKEMDVNLDQNDIQLHMTLLEIEGEIKLNKEDLSGVIKRISVNFVPRFYKKNEDDWIEA
jgi:hypothetical protein